MRLKFASVLSILSVLIVFLLLTFASAQPPISAEDLINRCRTEGSIALVRDLAADNGKEWDAVIEKIASGDPRWIDASACLITGVYFGGHASLWLDLEVTWAKLLTSHPREILRLEMRGVSILKACGLPFIEPEEEFIEDYVVRTLKALDGVEDVSLQDAKKACQLVLKEAYKS